MMHVTGSMHGVSSCWPVHQDVCIALCLHVYMCAWARVFIQVIFQYKCIAADVSG